MLSAFVQWDVVVCDERFGVWCACTWQVVGKCVVDGLSAEVAVAADFADVVAHAVLHGAVASDH